MAYTSAYTKRNTTHTGKYPQRGQGGFGKAKFGISTFGQPGLNNKYTKRNTTYTAKYT